MRATLEQRSHDHRAYLWRTPHRLYDLVDHTGTTVLDPETADALLRAPPQRAGPAG